MFIALNGFALGGQCQTPSFVNGDFELYNASAPGASWVGPGNLILNVSPGSSALTDWRVSYGNIDVVFPPYWQAASGGASLNVNGWVRGGIEQNVTFTAASQYYVDFMLSQSPASSVSDLGVWYKAPGASQFVGLGLFEFNTTTTASDMRWTLSGTRSISVSPGTYTFAFGSITPNDPYGPALDEVNLHPGASPFTASPDPGVYPGTSSVPEPSDCGLAAGLALLAFVCWRRRLHTATAPARSAVVSRTGYCEIGLASTTRKPML
jgi:hypothetical protein